MNGPPERKPTHQQTGGWSKSWVPGFHNRAKFYIKVHAGYGHQGLPGTVQRFGRQGATSSLPNGAGVVGADVIYRRATH